MNLSPQEIVASFVLVSGIAFVLFSLAVTKSLPILTEIFSVALSITGGISGINLAYEALFGTKNFGDFSNDKMLIALGGVGVFWVSLTTIIDLCKRVLERKQNSSDQTEGTTDTGC
ncbi:TPA: hypothetical protein ACGUS9_004175 [Vibrio vulnificus]